MSKWVRIEHATPMHMQKVRVCGWDELINSIVDDISIYDAENRCFFSTDADNAGGLGWILPLEDASFWKSVRPVPKELRDKELEFNE